MIYQHLSQSFNVNDIRFIREKADIRYRNMNPGEISRDIHDRALTGYKILEELKMKNHTQINA